MKIKALVAAGLLSVAGIASPAVLRAQMDTGAPDQASMGKPMDPAKALDSMLSLFENDCMGVLNAMPAEKYSFAPSAGTFAAEQGAKFGGVRTFAQQATHVMQANYYFYSTVSGTKPDVDVKALGAMTTKEQIVPAMQAAFAFAHRAVASITAANAFTTFKGADGMNTRATLAAFGVAHGFDHFGQMVEYLRMNGVVPPGSK